VPFGYFQNTAVASFERAQAKTLPPGALHGYPTRIGSIYLPTGGHAPDISGAKTALLWQQGACAHLIISSGHCPTGPGQAMISKRTADGDYGWKPGTTLTFTAGVKLTVVGTYTPRNPDGAFWFGQNYFDAAPGNGHPDTVDAVFVARSAFDAIPRAQGVLAWNYPLDTAAIRLDNLPRLRHDVAALARRISKTTPYSGQPPAALDAPVDLQLSTGLNTVLDAAAHQRQLVDAGTLLVTLQLTLLAWLVLFQVITDAVESRGDEIALAKLRGLRPSRTARFVLGEPLALLVAAVPFGLGLAWVAAALICSAALVPGTPVVPTWYTAAALAGGFAGGVLAAAAGSVRALRRSVLAQWRRTTARAHRSLAGLAIDVLVSLAAIGGLLALRAEHTPGSGDESAALLAPGLLVIAVALLGTRLLPLLTRLLLPPTRASGRIALFLAARQVVRRPAGLRLAALLAVAVGLATFAVSGEAVADVNRDAQARAEVGADQVVPMSYVAGVDPIAAVRTADPDGQWAMAAASWLPDGGDSVVGTVLGVDASRMATVGYSAAGGASAAQIADTVGTSSNPVIRTTAARMRVRVTAFDMTGTAPRVQFLLRTPREAFRTVPAGTLRPGTHTYTAPTACASGCILLGLVWDRPTTYLGSMSGTVTVHRIEQYRAGKWRTVDAALRRAGSWRPGPEFSHSRDELTVTQAGLRDRYRSDTGGYGGVSYAFAPQPLPAIATAGSVVTGPQAPSPLQMVDAFGTTTTFTVARRSSVLPLVLDNGLIVDLTYLRALLPAFDTEAHWMIWLGPDAPPDALARLRAAGLTLHRGTTTHARVVQLGRQGPALSLFLLLACAIIGAVVAVGGTAIAISAGARRRSFETAALRVVGVPRSFLYRGGVFEQLLLLGAAVALGIPSGVIAARLAMPVIPEFATATPVLLSYVPPALPIVAFAAGFVLLVCLTAVIAARSVLRAARPSRLREAEE
jgi:hypothetical protein